MRSWYRETRFECGDYMDVNIYPVYTKNPYKRKKAKPTSETQQRINDKNAEQNLIRIANANFTEEDMKVELTYRKEIRPQTYEESQRELANFLRRVKRAREKKGLPELKFIGVTETGKEQLNPHHHLIMSGGMDQNEISELWGRGYTRTSGLIFDENGIATLIGYMLKQLREFTGKKKYTRSRNLVIPQAKQRDNRLSKKQVKELAKDTECRAEYEKLYEGYNLSQAKVVYNESNGGVYIYARYYKQEAAWCKPKKKLNRSHSLGGQSTLKRNMRN
jgi:hypothetical protein